jgi:TRAP-type C4-dicarboxylate transport system permease large subunit
MTAIIFIIAITIRAMLQPKWAPRFTGDISWRARFTAGPRLISIGILFFIVIGSMYFGWATPTEEAAMGSSASLLIGLAMRRLSFKSIVMSCWDTGKIMAIMTVLLALSVVFVTFVTKSGLVASIATFFSALAVPKLVFLLVVTVLYLILGMFMSALPMLVLTLPFIYPAMIAMDINTIWFGILFIIWAELGCITPPFGIYVFTLKAAMGDYLGTWEIFKGCFFYVPLWLLATALLILFPQICLWLPSMMMGL